MDDVENEVLSLATEDYYGLWELTVQVPVGRDRLAQAIQGLIGSQLVAWFYRSSDTAQPVREGNRTPEQPDLADDSIWRTPGPFDAQWLLGSTDRGDQAYFGSGTG